MPTRNEIRRKKVAEDKQVSKYVTNEIPSSTITKNKVNADPDIEGTRGLPQDIAHIGIKKRLRKYPKKNDYEWDKKAKMAKDIYEESYKNDKVVIGYFK